MKKVFLVLMGILMAALFVGCMTGHGGRHGDDKEALKRGESESGAVNHKMGKEYYEAFKKEYGISDIQVGQLVLIRNDMEKYRKDIMEKAIDGKLTKEDILNVKSQVITKLKTIMEPKQVDKLVSRIEALIGDDFITKKLEKFNTERAALVKELNLTQEQLDKIKTILKDNAPKHDGKCGFFGRHKNGKPSMDFEKGRKEIFQKIKTVLTPEQAKKFEEHFKNHSPENMLKTELNLTDEQLKALSEKHKEGGKEAAKPFIDYFLGKITVEELKKGMETKIDELSGILTPEQIAKLKEKIKEDGFMGLGFFHHKGR